MTNAEELYATQDEILADPTAWDQGTYYFEPALAGNPWHRDPSWARPGTNLCGTVACFAGYTALRHGYTVEVVENGDSAGNHWSEVRWCDPQGRLVFNSFDTIGKVAAEILGLDSCQQSVLFNYFQPEGSIEERTKALKEMVDALASGWTWDELETLVESNGWGG